jgi:hypothetical protein
MCAEQGACVRRRSWAGYTIDMFEFEFPKGTGITDQPVGAIARPREAGAKTFCVVHDPG